MLRTLSLKPLKAVIMTLMLFSSEVCVFSQDVFVSSSSGDDTNDGYSSSTPVKTIKKAIELGDTIHLAAGDTFYEYLELDKKLLTRYGEGTNPVISGLRYIQEAPWINLGDNIWRIDLTTAISKGFVVSGSSELNNIGCFYEPQKDILHGRKCSKLDELNSDWDFFQTDIQGYKTKGVDCFDELYLYYTGNPNDLQLALSVGSHYGIQLNNSTVDGVNVIGFGTGGINLFETCDVKNCRIDIIGGSMMLYGNNTVSLGNGIDFWLSKSASDCTIENNYISRCFDCGCSIQIIGAYKSIPQNIVFRNNLISHCCQGWEGFLCNGKEGNRYDNCRFENNIVVYAGLSGFGYAISRVKYCNILDDDRDGERGMIIRNNTFVGGNYYCGAPYNGHYYTNIWDNNTHYVSRGSYILNNQYGIQQDKLWIPQEGSYKSIINHYRALTNDYSTTFKVRSGSKIKKISNREIKKFLKKHKY